MSPLATRPRIINFPPHLPAAHARARARLVGAVDFATIRRGALLPRVSSDTRIDLGRYSAAPDLVVAWPNAGSLRAVGAAGLGMPVFRSGPRELDDIAFSAWAGSQQSDPASPRRRVPRRAGALRAATPRARAGAYQMLGPAAPHGERLTSSAR
jgi:hypothetical protein